jgi:hypothetical protein
VPVGRRQQQQLNQLDVVGGDQLPNSEEGTMVTTFEAWYYFLFGLSLSLYFVVLCLKKEQSSTTGKDLPMKRIYLNLFFIDRTEFIHNIIRTKVPKSRPLVRALAKRAAAALLKDGIVPKVSQALCKTIQGQMEKMGLKCTVNLVYTQAAFAAIEISVQSLDLHQFFLFGAGSHKASSLTNILDRFCFPAMIDFFRRYFLGIVVGKLLVQLPNTIKEKLYNKMNTAIEVVACSEEDQGPFFVQMISQLNEGKEVSKEAAVNKDAQSIKEVAQSPKSSHKDHDNS